MRLRRAVRASFAIAASIVIGAPVAQAAPPRKKPGKPPPSQAEVSGPSIEVTVVDVAGGLVYVKPGAGGGVRRGAKVVIDGRSLVVTQATAAFAVLESEGEKLPKEGDRGRATIVAEQEDQVVDIKTPRPQSAFDGLWPDAAPPSSLQNPNPVPLGDVERDRRWDVRVSALGGALVPLGRGSFLGRAELNARVHAEPLSAPLAIDADMSLQQWFGPGLDLRDGRSARPLVRARELLLSYGNPRSFIGSLGRMRYAASTLGMLDGLRVQAGGLGHFSVAAFGGLLPDPLSTTPALDAQRFGVEAMYSAPEVAARPEAALVVHGSTFDGKLDERRISGVIGLFPGRSRVGGHFEVSNFDSNNPWGASSVELTAAGADTSVRVGPVQIGGRFDLRQPERSRYIASLLPTSFLCLTTPAPAATPSNNEPCDGRVATRAQGAGDVNLTLGNFSATVGGTIVRDLSLTKLPSMLGGFGAVRVVRIARVFRAEASGSYSTASYLDMMGASAGPGVSLLSDRLDLGVYYRFARIDYAVSAASFTQHGAGTSAMLLAGPSLTFTLNGEGIVGDDAEALMVFLTTTWRPRF